MDWRKIWWIILILSFKISLTGSHIHQANLDSLETDEIIRFFDTTTYEPDTLAGFEERDSIKISHCSDSAYQLDDRLALYGFKSGRVSYRTRLNETVTDSFLYLIDCGGGRQFFQFTKGQKTWRKVIDLTQDYTYLFNYKDSIGYMEVNEWKNFADSVDNLEELKKDDFFSKLKLAAGILSNDWGIHFAGIGRVAGKSCMKIHLEKMNKTVWFWKKLILKTETITPNDEIEIIEAYDFKVDIPIADSNFIIPRKKWQKPR